MQKREGYRRLFAGFDPTAVAGFTARDIERLLQDAGIVRNRLKVESTVVNAARVLEVQEDVGSLDAYLWSFVEGEPIVGRPRALADLPALRAERTVTQVLLVEGQHRARLYDPTGAPPAGFEKIPVSLEDSYLVLMQLGALPGRARPAVPAGALA